MSLNLARCASIAALIGLLGLGACNTVEGAGKDLQKGGEKIEEAAKDVKRKL